ncbi:MAG: molybdenum cofactor cytidylyltransferase [Deltaproteobacteria bacterium]|nr:molybdenum cofactor cytidylyltransferase [Deltaproteobacteria bacterium]
MNRAPRVAGIILAAGRSSRMGRPKQLLSLRGQTVIECVIDSALASSLDKLVVVLGHRAEEIRGLLTGRDVTVVRNTDYQRGQSSSLRVGLRAVREEVDAVLFLLGDQPLIIPETIDSILTAYINRPAPIVIPRFDGRRGNPVLFDRQTFARIDALSGDTGGRVLFQEYAGDIVEVPLHDPAVHFDIDTEQDYQMLKKM